MLKDVLQQGPAIVQTQFVHQKRNQIAMPAIANRLVIQRPHIPPQRFAQRANPAGCVERLVIHAIERKMLQPLQRQHLQHLPLMNRLAWIAIFIDQPIRGPGEVVLHLIGRKLRQRANPQSHLFEPLKSLRQVIGRDGDESRRQTALRHENPPARGMLGDLADRLGRRHVFGQIKVAGPRFQSRLCDGRIHIE